jgi:2-(1,2-epoxy-1,2-dihydrophenyl)acetyl-CoA isomerase
VETNLENTVESTVILEITEKGVAIIRLNRPKALNAINDQMKRELRDVVRQVAQDPAVKAVILTGEGRAFCAGGDVKEMSGSRQPMYLRNRMRSYLHQIIIMIQQMEKPVITAVNGFAVGAGCNLALSGDIILASDQAKFSEIFVQVGLVPDAGGFYFLPRLIGLHRAKELVFSGKMVDAAEADRIGLVNHVYPHEELLPKALEMANRFAEGPLLAIGMAKTMLNQSADLDLIRALDYEAAVQAVMANTEDHQEGVKAFAEKRKPKFSGK